MAIISTDEIISILKEVESEIHGYDFSHNEEEVGTVIFVGDSIARICGIEHVMYGEIVVFENGDYFINIF